MSVAPLLSTTGCNLFWDGYDQGYEVGRAVDRTFIEPIRQRGYWREACSGPLDEDNLLAANDRCNLFTDGDRPFGLVCTDDERLQLPAAVPAGCAGYPRSPAPAPTILFAESWSDYDCPAGVEGDHCFCCDDRSDVEDVMTIQGPVVVDGGPAPDAGMLDGDGGS